MPKTDPSRNIFLFVTGRTPQIITETLFFYLVRLRSPIRPHEIHVLTTTEGYRLICDQMLTPRNGRFYQFCRDYHLDPGVIHFSAQTVEVLHDRDGRPLKDIRTDADNRAAADQIVAKVRMLTADPGSRLFASLAGGRKTMGLYLGLGLQLYGRPQDRLTHVLVNPLALENNPEFFYPPPRRRSLPPSRRAESSGEVRVTLAEVPLILLRHKLPVLRDRSDLSYAALVARSQHEVDLLRRSPPVSVDRMGRRLRIGDAIIPLSGLEFVLYDFVARKRRRAACEPDCPGCRLCTVGAADFMDAATIDELQTAAAGIGLRDPRLQQLRWWAAECEEGKKRFLQVSARIKRKVRAVLGEASNPYTIAPLWTRPARVARYTITINKTLIRFS